MLRRVFKMKRKIVFIINSLKNGGPVNMLYTLIKHVDANKFDMYVIALNKCDPNNERNFNELSCKVVTLSDNENTMKHRCTGCAWWLPDGLPEILHRQR